MLKTNVVRRRRNPLEDRHTMNMQRFNAYRPTWNWQAMKGSAACLKWSLRDLANLEAALPYVPGRRVAVQAGGNLGIFPKRLAESFETVYSFEPDPELFGWCARNAPERNIIFVCAALGCERTGVSVACRRRDPSNRPVHEGLTHVAGRGKIRQMLIDDLELEACDLVYLDVEGYELNALKGAQATIRAHRPVIAVEINRNIGHYGTTADQLRQWIVDFGYRKIFEMNSDEVFAPC